MSPRGPCCLPTARAPTLVGCFGDGFLLGQPRPSHSPRCLSPSQSLGFSLLACSSYHWQLSFLRAEQVLLQQLDEDGGCRRKCFQALRQMKEDVWCPGTRPVITSHHLQVRGGPSAEGWAGGSLQRVCVCESAGPQRPCPGRRSSASSPASSLPASGSPFHSLSVLPSLSPSLPTISLNKPTQVPTLCQKPCRGSEMNYSMHSLPLRSLQSGEIL